MALDERLRRAIEHAGEPADPSGVYEDLIRRRERRRMARRLTLGGVSVAVIAACIVGVVILSRVFAPAEPRPGADGGVVPSVQPEPTPGDGGVAPSVQPDPTPADIPPTGEDIGLGFPVCNVTSVPGRFADPNTPGIAFVATRMGDTGGCPDATGAFNMVAIDVNGDGVADTSYGPIVCENAACVAWAAPDVDGDGTDELLVQNVAFSMPGLKLFDLLGDGADGLTLVPVTVAPPGSAELGYQGFEAGTEPQFWTSGDAFSAAAIRCEPWNGERAFVSVAAEIVPPDAPDAHWEVVETVFLLRDGQLRVVDVREFTHPFFNDDVVPFLESGGCGANLRHYG